MIIVEGRIIDFVVLLFISIVTVYMMSIADRWTPKIRKIAGIEVIPELIGRATELGRPVHFSTGRGPGLSQTETGPQVLAGLTVFSHVARLCARNGIKLIVSVGQPDTLPLLEEYIKEAYRLENVPIPDITDTLRYHSTEQFSYTSAVTGLMRRERPAANIFIGPTWAEAPQLIISAAQVGAMQLFGTARPALLSWVSAFSDYTLIGEEVYAGGAVISQDRDILNTIATQDVGKFLAIAIILLGVILAMFGSTLIKDLMVI